jgi:hypothetical protein
MLQGGARRAFVAPGFSMSAVANFLSTQNEPAGVIRWPTSFVGVNVGSAIHS